MITPILRRSVVAAFAALLAGCASYSTSHVTPLGGNLYQVTRDAGTILSRNADKMKEAAQADAEKFCEQRGKQLQIVDVDLDKPMVGTGFVSVKVTFRALEPGETPPPPPPSAPAMPASPAYAPAPMAAAATIPPPSGDLYTALKKLEELRKEGILSQDEFDAEKKKILAETQ